MKTSQWFISGSVVTIFLTVMTTTLHGCGSNASVSNVTRETLSPSPYGRFLSNYCFLNKLASAGFGSDVYSKANLQFNSDGTGKNEYKLYNDDTCTSLAMMGENNFTHTISQTYGNIALIQVDQENDPADPTDVTRYWLPAVIQESGYLIDIDFRDGNSGPYLTEPTETEIADFAADVQNEGVLFSRE